MLGISAGIDIGARVGFAKTNDNQRIYMISYNHGFTGSPLNASASYFRNNTIFDE